MSAEVASPDGRQFRFAGVHGVAVEPGGFVLLRDGAGVTQLGQLDEVEHSIGGTTRGSGRVLGTVSYPGASRDAVQAFDSGSTRAFSTAELRPATADIVEALQASARATLEIGEYLSADGVPARLIAQRFNRHTFWCGQSGSGKTYALGVVLEQLLLHTALPMVVLDPNADFVRLGESRVGESRIGESRVGWDGVGEEGVGESGAGSGGDDRAILARRDIRVLRPSAADALRVRFVDLPTRAKGAVLHLHPLDDRAEYNELVRLEESVGSMTADEIVPALRARETAAASDLAARIENLRVTEWSVWSAGRTPVTEIVEARPDATVLDLGGFEHPDEPLVVAMAVLDDLWAKRESRRPVLIVIDEAHNLCSPELTGALATAVRDRIVQIAAEGRKFGLWLLLSTQRPSRVHPSIISQCDNLALMKMTSPADLDELATVFGFVPPALFARSPRFRQGEALFAGGFVAAPALIRMGERLSPEGGADVGVPLREEAGWEEVGREEAGREGPGRDKAGRERTAREVAAQESAVGERPVRE